MGGDNIKLIGAVTSLFCTRVEWALRLKGAKYEYVAEDLRDKSELLLKSNPVHKKVPVLLDDGRAIAESLVILEYVDERWKGGLKLLPEDPYERAQARFWAKFADDKCVWGVWKACVAEGEEKKKAVEAAVESFVLLEKQLEGKKWFSGEEMGYLDVALGWIPHFLGVLEEVGGMKIVKEDQFPLLVEWGLKFSEVPELKECVPPREVLINYLTAGISYSRSLPATN
ncbi:hypothetical protein MLD38_013349 [Melastoma candidum]|uniref:Uncharacterized protein n=1 Tax=Melastoma candidum TaxID=119954 RepID=A0ACB9R9W4_9MYRT|nr:hypothetical protein MLD38_013349 [Melastoma candidum]